MKGGPNPGWMGGGYHVFYSPHIVTLKFYSGKLIMFYNVCFQAIDAIA